VSSAGTVSGGATTESKHSVGVVRPTIFHDVAAACRHPYVKNVMIMVNSIYNGWRWWMSDWTSKVPQVECLRACFAEFLLRRRPPMKITAFKRASHDFS
jgi:hypothetical protein